MWQKTAELRGHNEVIEMSPDEMQEYIKCATDIFHFSKYFYILTGEGERPIELREYQVRLVKMLTGKYYFKNEDGTDVVNANGEKSERNNRIIMMGRQTGKTTLATLYILWYALFNKDKTIAVLANKESQALEIMLRIRSAILKLPLWLQQGINPDRGGWSKGTIGFDNGSKIFAAASSSSSIRGKSVDFMLVDEFAFLPENDANDFMMSVFPTQSSRKESRLILISTPHGMNHFYKIWQKAIAGLNTFVPAKVQWNEVEGRDEDWKNRMIRDVGPQFFAQEYACLYGDEKVTIKVDVPDGGLSYEYTDKIENIYKMWPTFRNKWVNKLTNREYDLEALDAVMEAIDKVRRTDNQPPDYE